MGGRYSGYRRVGFHDTHSPLAGGATERALARQGWEFPQRCLACDRTIHPARPESPRVRSFDRGYEGLYATLEDQHAALSTSREKYAAPGVQMRGVHGGAGASLREGRLCRLSCKRTRILLASTRWR